MYLIQISYKYTKYKRYNGKIPKREILNVRTLYQGPEKLIR